MYIPLGGNRKGKLRKQINTMVVFLVSGLWHGASIHFVVWGGLNGIYKVFSDITKNFRGVIKQKLHIDATKKGYKVLNILTTFCLVDLSWLFFRANGFRDAINMIQKILTDFDISYLFSDEIFNMFINMRTLFVIVISLIFIFIVDYLKTKKINMIDCLLEQQLVFRWMVYFAIIFIIIVYGAYGDGYEQTQFIYFQF